MPAPATGALPAAVVVLMRALVRTGAGSTSILAPATGTGHTLRSGIRIIAGPRTAPATRTGHTLRSGVGVITGARGALISFGTRGLG